MNKLVKASIALAAFAAFAVLPASASASNNPMLEAPTGTVVPIGSNIISTSEGVILMTNAWGETVFSCQTATATGTLVTNSHAGGIAIIINSAVLQGSPSTKTHTGHCDGLVGYSTLAFTGLPWCLRSDSTSATDTFTLRGGGCTEGAKAIQFTWNVTTFFGPVQCGYQRTASQPITGTYRTHPDSATLTIKQVEFKSYLGSSLCSENIFLDYSFFLYRETAASKHLAFIKDVT